IPGHASGLRPADTRRTGAATKPLPSSEHLDGWSRFGAPGLFADTRTLCPSIAPPCGADAGRSRCILAAETQPASLSRCTERPDPQGRLVTTPPPTTSPPMTYRLKREDPSP